MKLTIYIVATLAALFLAITTANFLAWWFFASVVSSPLLIGLCKVASDADDELGYK